MSHARLPRNEVYLELTAMLREAGLGWREEMGGKHGKLIVDVGGREETVIVSCSPSDRHATSNARAWLKRKLREWGTAPSDQQESPMENMVTQIAPVEREVSGTPIPTVNARDLHAFLGVGKVFGAWINDRISQYGFVEGADFEVYSETGNNPSGGRPAKEYALTIDMAKELSMVERSARGKEARRYFIECERAARAQVSAIAAPADDIQAVLELLADLRSSLVAAQQAGALGTLEHVEGGKAAVLHYLKAYLREPASAFYEDVRARNLAAYKRDHQTINALSGLTEQVKKLLALLEPTAAERPFVWADWFDTARIYAEFFSGVAIPKRGFLSQAMGRALDGHCKRRRLFHHMEQRVVGGVPRNFWHRDAVVEWLDAGGRAIVADHIDRHSLRPAEGSLRVVEGGRA